MKAREATAAQLKERKSITAMRSNWSRGLSTLILLVTLGLAWCGSPEAAQKRVPLFLRAVGAFDPTAAQPRIPADLSQAAVHGFSARSASRAAPPKGVGHWIVQFRGPVLEHWKESVGEAGGRLLHYLPQDAFVVRLANRQVRKVRRLPYVRAVTPFHPAYALSPALPRPSRKRLLVNIRTFSPEDLPAVQWATRRMGGRITSVSAAGDGMLTANLTSAAIRALARTFGIAWIEPVPAYRIHSSQANGITRVDTARQQVSLYGTNQIVAVADTGLDRGPADAVGLGAYSENLHADFTNRILQVHDLNERGAAGEVVWSDPNGHGTHVTGALLGSGRVSGADPATQFYNSKLSGVAPEASLVFQSILDNDGNILGHPDVQDLYFMFQRAYDAGARVHNNSWGAENRLHQTQFGTAPLYAGQYFSASQAVDRFIRDHPDMVIVFSAGNGAQDEDGDGIIDFGQGKGTVEIPATAKNCITVGATENGRPEVNVNYGRLMPFASLFSPIVDDPVANLVHGMAAFSARGYCADTTLQGQLPRIKPDIVAPGTYVAAARTGVTFLREGFESTAVGSIPPDWARSGLAAVTDRDAYPTPGRSVGFGDPVSGYPPLGSGLETLSLPTHPDLSQAPCLYVSYRTKYHLRSGDSVKLSYGSTIQDSSITGSSNGAWFYRTDVIRPITPSVDQVTFNLTGNGTEEGTFYFLIDDIQVTPGLGDVLSNIDPATTDTALDAAYQFASGTSVAAAQVSGAAALVRQWYQEVMNHAQPSAALVKATLLTNASDLFNTPDRGQYPGKAEQPAPRPNPVQGWGRLDVANAVLPGVDNSNRTVLFADVAPGLGTDEFDEYKITVQDGTPLSVGIVWTDPPASPASGVTLVNNLDLVVRTPDNSERYGNGTGNAGDDRNNVETVDIPSPLTSGTYTIRVNGKNVPLGKQPYALVVYGQVRYAPESGLRISPSYAQCQFGRSYRFTAYYQGIPTTGVEWKVLTDSGGFIDSTGVYTAPNAGGPVEIQAAYTLPGTSTTFTATAKIDLVGSPLPDSIPTAFIVVDYAGLQSEISVVQYGHDTSTPPPGPPTSPDYRTDNKPGDPTAPGSGGTFTRTFALKNPPAGSLPPQSGQHWWVQVTNEGTANATVPTAWLVYNGKKYTSAGPVTVPANSVTYIYIDPATERPLPEVYAYVEIYHPRPSDLSRIVVGTPANGERSEWTSAVETGASATSNLLTLGFDLTGAPEGALPPDADNSWYVRIEDDTTGETGVLRKFYILYNGAYYHARHLPLGLRDGSAGTPGTGIGWIDYTPPKVQITAPAHGSTVTGAVTLRADAQDNAWVARVEFSVDDRLLSSDTEAPYEVAGDTTHETNGWHRAVARAFDASGNWSEHSIDVYTGNGGTRPNVAVNMSNWAFDPATRELTGTITLRNNTLTGTRAYNTTLQRVTLYGTGPSFTGTRRLYMQPMVPPPLPLRTPGTNPGEIAPESFATFQLKVVVPPEITAVPRWSAAGFYSDQATGGTFYHL